MSDVQNLYLVDYENVNEKALEGVEKLTDKDMVCIFTAQPNVSISVKTLSLLNKVNLQCFVVCQSKQSVDMCISSYLGYLLGKNAGTNANYIVVSKDTDYDCMLKFWSNMGYGSFSRRTKIAEDDAMVELEAEVVEEEKTVVPVQVPVPVQSLSCQKNVLIQKILSEKGVDNEKVNQVASIVSKHIEEKNHKQVIYRAITSKFGQQEGLDLYTLIKKSL